MDSLTGTFALDLDWKPLLRVFEGKMKWTELLAVKKDMTFLVVDNTLATEAGLRKLTDRLTRLEASSRMSQWDLLEGIAFMLLIALRGYNNNVLQMASVRTKFTHLLPN